MTKIFILLWALNPIYALAQNIDFRSNSKLDAEDYLMRGYGNTDDPIFDRAAVVNLDVDIGIASDCGRIDVRHTMRAALKNMLNADYFKSMGRDIVAGSPMLITCYMSPTWCAILKQFRLRANFLANLRLNQCRAIDRYVDNRVEDFYEQRSQCVRNKIGANSGNFESAMEGCKNYSDFNLKDWSGSGIKKNINKVIDSSAKWAGFEKGEAKRVVDLTKSFLGDEIVKHGHVSIDYGPHRMQMTPRTYLADMKDARFKNLCLDLLPKVNQQGTSISKQDLKRVSGGNRTILDRQTLVSLSLLPYQKRKLYCRKLADALAIGGFTEDMGKTLDFIASKVGSNPHLPANKRVEVDRRRRAFKDQIELTLSIEQQERTPLGQVLYQINKEGEKYRSIATQMQLDVGHDIRKNDRINSIFLDCGDGIGCR